MLLEKKEKFYTGQISFFLFYLIGILKPITWNSRWKIWFYNLYSLFMITLYFIFVFSIFIYILRIAQNAEAKIETTFQFLALFNVFFKMISILIQTKTAIESINLFMNEICQPRDKIESEILKQSSHYSRQSQCFIFSKFRKKEMNFFFNLC